MEMATARTKKGGLQVPVMMPFPSPIIIISRISPRGISIMITSSSYHSPLQSDLDKDLYVSNIWVERNNDDNVDSKRRSSVDVVVNIMKTN